LSKIQKIQKILCPPSTHLIQALAHHLPTMPGETKKDMPPAAKKLCLNYLSSKILLPYPPAVPDVDRTPYQMISFWKNIFLYLAPTDTERIHLRRLCHLFHDSLGTTPDSRKGMYTVYPHPNHASLQSLMRRCHELYDEDPTKAPTIFFIKEGDHEINVNHLEINYPIKIIGAGRDKTFIRGGGFYIQGRKEVGKKVELKDMTMRHTEKSGVYGNNGLSFLCDSMTFTQCGGHGIWLFETTGRLINCVITQCGYSGIYCYENALIELKGSQTKVHGNGTRREGGCYGLRTWNTSSFIHLLHPLTKESVSTNNRDELNYGSKSGDVSVQIRTVDSF